MAISDETAVDLVKIRLIGRGRRDLRLDFVDHAFAERPRFRKTGTSRAVSFSSRPSFHCRPPIVVTTSRRAQTPCRGPLIIDEFDATIVVPPDAKAWRDAIGMHRHGTRRACVNVDPITFAVIKSGLESIVDDMAYTVVRIARSEIVKDVMDFSAALCDARGQMIAQAKTIALHLGAVPEAIEAVLTKFGDDLQRGRRRRDERSVSRRHAPARYLHVHADLRGRHGGAHFPS